MGSEGRDSFKGFIGRKRAKQQKKKRDLGVKQPLLEAEQNGC